MKRYFIIGTSGVGKSHLLNELHAHHGFEILSKYTDRPPRIGEIEGKGIHFWDRKKIDENENLFFFTLYYAGFRYSWMKSDLENVKDKKIAFDATLESMKDMNFKKYNFIPIYLYVDEDHYELLTERNKKKVGYEKLADDEKKLADINLRERLNLARQEQIKHEEYYKIVEENHGKVFNIKDDNTLYKEVLPYILNY